jgi:hypothetical protein
MTTKVDEVNIGDDVVYKGKAIIGYIDILGFSNSISNNWDEKENNPLETVLAIKGKLAKASVRDKIRVKKANGEKKIDINIYSRIQTISDSFIISHPISEINAFSLFSGLYNIAENILDLWKLIIQNNYTIRGSISFGEIYWNRDEIIGPAFIEAYRNEEQCSRVSRVIVNSSCNMLIKKAQKSEFNVILNDHFVKDIDGYTILNPRKVFKNNVEKEQILDKLNTIKSQQTDVLIKEKYTPLINAMKLVNHTTELLDY